MINSIANLKMSYNCKKKGYLLIAMIAMIYFFYMLRYCDIRSLWMDDLAQIQIASEISIKEMIKATIAIDNNPPLFHLLSYLWIRLTPYGTGWLKLLNIIFVSAGLYICGLTAMEIRNRVAGITCALMGALQRGVVFLAAYTFRPYGLFFFTAALMLYLYVKSRKAESLKRETALGICMLLCVYTHYFAILICMGFFLVDVYLVLRRQLNSRHLLLYPMTGVLFFPWFCVILKSSVQRLKNFWPQKPDFSTLIKVFYELCGDDKIISFIVLLCIIIVLYYFLKNIGKEKRNYFTFLLLLVPTISISGVYLASKYSDSFTSLFVTRYFVGIFPFVEVLCGVAFSLLFEKIIQIVQLDYMKKMVVLGTILLFVFLFIRNTNKTLIHENMFNEPFREVAEYLILQNDINDNNVIVYNTCNTLPKGWDYYLTHKGVGKSVDVKWENITDNDLEGVDKIYVAVLHLPFDSKNLDVIEKSGFQKDSDVDNLPIQIYRKKTSK